MNKDHGETKYLELEPPPKEDAYAVDTAPDHARHRQTQSATPQHPADTTQATPAPTMDAKGQVPIAQATVVSSAPPPAYAPAPGGAGAYGATGIVTGVVAPDQVYVNPQLSISERVAIMQRELDLEKDIVEDLLSVAGADIVVVADDSGSMSCVANPGNYQNPMTRWDELRETLIKLAHMLLVVDHSDGFNVQFLNDPTWHEIHSKEQVESLFVGRSPRGTTPLGARLAPLLDGSWHPKGHGAETDLILIVMTDGSPSDVDFGGLTRLVAGKKANVYVTFMMCTEDDDVVGAYNRHLDRIPGVDITDDYASEKKEVEAHGRKLSYYKWLAKATLGGKLVKYDKMDEHAGGCCVVA